MNSLHLIFLLVSFVLFVIEISYELYFTAIIQLIALLVMFYAAVLFKRGHLSRLMMVALFFISYPMQVIIMATGQSTFSLLDWKNNDFIFEDMQNALIIAVSASLYLIFILAHNFLSFGLYDGKIKVQDSNFVIKKKVKQIFNKKIINFFWLCAISLLIIVLIIQNKYGWGVHGLLPYRENILKGVGLTIYLRDYFIPITIAILLFLQPKISFSNKVILLIFSFLSPATSLSKVTIIIYFFLITYAIQKDSILSKKNFLTNLKWIFLLGWFLFIYVVIMTVREVPLYIGAPIQNPVFLFLSNESLNIEKFIEFMTPVHFYSLCERFLGFKELASVIYFDGRFYYEGNLFGQLSIGDFLNVKINLPREFTSNGSLGGVGVDWISALVMTGYFMIIPILLILLHFLIQILIIKSLPDKFKTLSEILLMIIFIRFAVDGNLTMIKSITFLLAVLLFFILGLKILYKKKHINNI